MQIACCWSLLDSGLATVGIVRSVVGIVRSAVAPRRNENAGAGGIWWGREREREKVRVWV
jgi:hypothetical protein